MNIHLSPREPVDKSYQWVQNIATLNGLVSDSEARAIVCDMFLAQFTYDEIPQVLEHLYKKMRTGCELTIIEPDLNFISRYVLRNGIDQDYLSQTVFVGVAIKSIPDMETVISGLPSNMQVVHRGFDEASCKSLIKIKRSV
tara:strand:+ start:2931 stop:3353 length:423 start_codon:yes stop_codon:yes gene_type:complete